MSDFDPYYQWLGIPPKDQPPHHYRLLGLDAFEPNAEVIARAADRQMAYLRLVQSGAHTSEAQSLLNKISAASGCLLDADRKAEYDEQLKAEIEAEEAAAAEEGGVNIAAFGEYELLDKIDKGGSVGQTFKAQHRTMGRIVALKILSPDTARTPDAVERFRRKVQILARLKHPNLVIAYDAGERDGVYYLITEFVDGDDLVSLVRQYNPLPVGHVVGYISQAAAGLGYAHANGVTHRNVKPSNIMVDREAAVKVIGLGMARVDHDASPHIPRSEITQAGVLIGTPDYMSPEQALGPDQVDHRADIYSLGCTMFSLLTGRPLFPVKTTAEKIKAHRHTEPPPISQYRSDIPRELDQVFHWMVAKRPEDRYQSMNDVIAALQPF